MRLSGIFGERTFTGSPSKPVSRRSGNRPAASPVSCASIRDFPEDMEFPLQGRNARYIPHIFT
jgi:hypothetical protein